MIFKVPSKPFYDHLGQRSEGRGASVRLSGTLLDGTLKPLVMGTLPGLWGGCSAE